MLTAGSLLWVKHPTVVGAELAEELVFEDKDTVVFGFWRDGKRDKPVVVPLAGVSTPAEVVRALDAKLAGRLQVELEDGRLRLALPQGPDTAFMVAPGRNPTIVRSVGLGSAVTQWHRRARPLFMLLAAVSVLWTVYHTLMQKYGLLRIYARKSGRPTSRRDAWVLFSWVGVVVAGLLASPASRELAARRFVELSLIHI